MIHPSSYVSTEARLGNGVEIGPFCIVHANVILGDRVKVHSNCELGISTSLGNNTPLIIGSDALIRSHSVFYESSSFGPGSNSHHSPGTSECPDRWRSRRGLRQGVLCSLEISSC